MDKCLSCGSGDLSFSFIYDENCRIPVTICNNCKKMW